MAALKQGKRSKTARYIAEQLNISERTVRNYFAQPRAEYEANSISKKQPWKELGISRATWYRKHRKDFSEAK